MVEACENDDAAEALQFYYGLRDIGCLTGKDILTLLDMVQRYFQGQARGSDGESLIPVLLDIDKRLLDGSLTSDTSLATVWARLLKVLVEAGHYAEARKTWEAVRVRRTPNDEPVVDSRSYAVAVEIYAAEPEALDTCKKLVRESLQLGLTPCPALYSSMILAYAWHGHQEDAFEFIRIAIDLFAQRLTTQWWSGIIARLSAWNESEMAQQVFMAFANSGRLPSPAVMTRLITDLKYEGTELQMIIKVLFKYIGAGGILSPPLVNSVLSAIFVSFAAESASTTKSPDTQTKAGFFGREAGSKASVAAPSSAAVQEATHVANAFLDHMHRLGFSDTIETYNALISGYCRLNSPEHVRETLRALDASGLAPTAVTYRALLKSFSNTDTLLEIIENVFGRLVALNASAPYSEAKGHGLDWYMLLQSVAQRPQDDELNEWLAEIILRYCSMYNVDDTSSIPAGLVRVFRRNGASRAVSIALSQCDRQARDKGDGE